MINYNCDDCDPLSGKFVNNMPFDRKIFLWNVTFCEKM